MVCSAVSSACIYMFYYKGAITFHCWFFRSASNVTCNLCQGFALLICHGLSLHNKQHFHCLRRIVVVYKHACNAIEDVVVV